MNVKNVYLDYAATTPMDSRIINEINKHFRETYGNASSLHSIGQRAHQILEKSRETIASLLNADKDDIFFTSSGTEADNLAFRIIKVCPRNAHSLKRS